VSSIPPVTDSAPLDSTPPIRDRTPEQADVQRGITPVSRVKPGGKLAPIAGGALVVAALLWINLGGSDRSATTNTMAMADSAKRRPTETARQVAEFQPGTAPTIATAATDPNAPSLGATNLAPGTPGTVTLANGQVVPAIQPGAYPANAGQGGPAQASPAQTLAQQSRRSPLLVFSAGDDRLSQQGAGQGGNAGGAMVGAADGTPAQQEAPGDLDRLRRASAIGESRATMMSNRNYLITAGTLIPCILQTAMNSTQPGYTSCIVPRDVFSENGRVVLLEKGTKVLGQYQGGLQQGQNRLFVVWTRATTPRGVAIDLGSPASDALGRAGMAGGVDTFFWARFGGALMLSLIDATAQIGSSALASNGSVNISQPSQAAGQTLQQNQNIRPVLKKNQGEEVGIFVAKDFNFSDVYGLAIK
jgi:type IV secretion system protein VirB10